MTIIRLIDTNRAVTDAWKTRFDDEPNVQVLLGNITQQKVDAWVTPTNSKGHMSGGVDAAIRDHLGEEIQLRIQSAIGQLYGGLLPVDVSEVNLNIGFIGKPSFPCTRRDSICLFVSSPML